MARREVLVQLDDQLVERLDAVASELGASRSELLRRAAAAVIEAHDDVTADAQLQAAYRAQPPDAALMRAAAALAAQTVPPW